MRIDWCDDEERPGQFALWDANCERSLNGKAGQRELRELEAALVALPEKRLISGALISRDGGVCAIACYARHKGVDLSKFDPEYESDEVGMAGGMPKLVAWKVVALNDLHFDHHTPEARYTAVLSWVRRQLGEPPSDHAVGQPTESPI